MEKDIIALQEQIAHQAVEITDLSDEVYAQQKEIAELKKYMQILEAKIQSAMDQESMINRPEDDPLPPHY